MKHIAEGRTWRAKPWGSLDYITEEQLAVKFAGKEPRDLTEDHEEIIARFLERFPAIEVPAGLGRTKIRPQDRWVRTYLESRFRETSPGALARENGYTERRDIRRIVKEAWEGERVIMLAASRGEIDDLEELLKEAIT
jgi:hypothetical protein